ncbi:hypothetical protein JQ604_21945 [Bradyrhizobium jicamae]|uniref:hypothetical protein n=1 Tax=Bradyrhizobium jicamae TaxID=280332 RepID=UPI001BA5800E|nr:hypothetical protein [Bradyrhizobium jicamae]MBR0754858.1 hypothetical protein [Bradyrhizobium jicamae]
MSRKPHLPILNVLSLLALAFMISGCSAFWSGPWPRVTVNTEGLGVSPLANAISRQTGTGVDDLKKAVAQFVVEQTSAKGISHNDAEALGMQCAPARSKECTYSGAFWIRDDQRYIRQDSPYYGKRTITHIDVRFSYARPHDVVVQANESLVPDE